jgi:hypothetical protein
MQAGMGVDAADVTGDGLPELFVTNFQNEHNALYVNTMDGLFQEASQQMGLYSEGYPWVGWGTSFADFDLDGDLDLVVTNGHVDDNLQLLGENSPYAQPALAWSQQDGKFTFLGPQAGDYFMKPHVGRALVVVDIDNDGDQDLVIGHQDDHADILRNNRLPSAGAPPRTYCLRLVGTRANRDAVGASITMTCGTHTALQQVKGGGSYLASHDPRRVFALPADAESPQFEVQWPGGRVSKIADLQPGVTNVIIQPLTDDGTPRVLPLP